jgi:hypothetical protein
MKLPLFIRLHHERPFVHELSFVLNLLVFLALLAGGARAADQPGTTAGSPSAAGPRINPAAPLPAALDGFPTLSGRHPDVPEDYAPAAENDTLRLYFREASAAIIVEDKRSGRLWRSSPADLQDNKGTTTTWRKQIAYPVQISYVDAERAQAKILKLDRVKLTYQPVEGGVRANFAFEETGLGFSLLFTLHQDCLQATLPEEAVVEPEENSLVDMDILPFLGATHDGDEGYIFFPDGSGALMHYDTTHPDQVQQITSVIYGTDTSGGLRGSTGTAAYRQDVVMPVFGLNAGQAGFLGIVTQGDFDATLNVARSGKGINYNHVWGQFLFRRQGRFSLTGGQPALLFQPDRIPGDRQIRYCFLNGPDASYTGMAARYRAFLVEERGAQRVAEDQPLINLAFFMGVERRTWFLADMVQMTSFSEAGAILDELAGLGVERADVTLWLWSRGATSGKYPQRLPVDPRLGGEEALLALAAATEARGQRLFLNDNYLVVAPGAPGVMPYLDAIRGVDGLPMGSPEEGYLLNPQVALERYAARDMPVMAGLGADGLELDAFARLALPDRNNVSPFSREGFAAKWMELAALARQQLGAAALDGSNTYAIPHADRLDFVTLDSTHYDLFDDTVPFFHIAAHGLVQYTGSPYNLISDGRRMWLRHVEYGATPFFVLTKASSAQLFRTGANGIYSSQYSTWRDEVIRQYQVMETLAPLAGQFITGHERLAEDVFAVTYEDGSRVIVNYRHEAYNLGGLEIPAQDFVLIPGD